MGMTFMYHRLGLRTRMGVVFALHLLAACMVSPRPAFGSAAPCVSDVVVGCDVGQTIVNEGKDGCKASLPLLYASVVVAAGVGWAELKRLR
jgi:hypothetical protein